ncbi:MAG: DUF86 domain-containing protein [Elusimicrobia bacterium]|nr:DUF86 domain-containing protein [Elusimicrobiota bacterium]
MIDKELIYRKINQLERALNRVKSHLPENSKIFASDYDAQDIVYRNFQIAAQNCVDISNHIIAEKRWEIPRTMGGGFEILRKHKIISSAIAKNLRDIIILRNIIVHDYIGIKIEKAYPLILKSFNTLSAFCKLVVR